jgi:hypothetical protein
MSTTRICGTMPQVRRKGGDAVGADRRQIERGGVDRARDHGDALGRDLVALDHGARDVARRRDYAVAARKRAAQQRTAGPSVGCHPVGKGCHQEHRLLVGGGKRTPGTPRALRMHDVDAFAGNQLG